MQAVRQANSCGYSCAVRQGFFWARAGSRRGLGLSMVEIKEKGFEGALELTFGSVSLIWIVGGELEPTELWAINHSFL